MEARHDGKSPRAQRLIPACRITKANPDSRKGVCSLPSLRGKLQTKSDGSHRDALPALHRLPTFVREKERDAYISRWQTRNGT